MHVKTHAARHHLLHCLPDTGLYSYTTVAGLCPEVKALKRNEEEIVDSLENADLVGLCGEAVEMRVIPQDVKKSLESMDWKSVTCPRVIRYLLMHVYRSVEVNSRLCERWIKLLRKYISYTNHVLEKLDYDIMTQTSAPSPVSAHVMCLTEGISDDIQSLDSRVSKPREANEAELFVPTAKRLKFEGVILERHIPSLTELLVGCAHKWESISAALQLPESVRKDLRVKQAGDPDCIDCFRQLLTKWVLGGYEHAKAPTLANLEKVLKSKTVGLGLDASKLQGIELNQLMCSDEQPPLPKKPCVEPLPL